jgi:uncharacterized membrane protein YhaH (DUF805 family)
MLAQNNEISRLKDQGVAAVFVCLSSGIDPAGMVTALSPWYRWQISITQGNPEYIMVDMAEMLLVCGMTAGGLDPNRLGPQEIAVVSTLVDSGKHRNTLL